MTPIWVKNNHSLQVKPWVEMLKLRARHLYRTEFYRKNNDLLNKKTHQKTKSNNTDKFDSKINKQMSRTEKAPRRKINKKGKLTNWSLNSVNHPWLHVFLSRSTEEPSVGIRKIRYISLMSVYRDSMRRSSSIRMSILLRT